MMLNDEFPMVLEVEAGAPKDTPPLAVSFGLYPLKDNKASREAGRDIYRDVEFVKIAIPGDKNSLVLQPATDLYRKRFPTAWKAYRDREYTPVQGTPLDQWAPASRSVVLNLRAMHIQTVEALAAVHEGQVDRLGAQGRQLRDQARAWLEEAKTGAETIKLAAEKRALQDQLEAMQAQMAAMQRQIDERMREKEGAADKEELPAPPKRGPGRPPLLAQTSGLPRS